MDSLQTYNVGSQLQLLRSGVIIKPKTPSHFQAELKADPFRVRVDQNNIWIVAHALELSTCIYSP